MAKKPERFPDEIYLQDALKSGKATIQDVSMKAIGTPDTRLQARIEHLDKEHVRKLHEIKIREGKLSPVAIFRTSAEKLLLADGFHRHEVYRNEKAESIPAYVIEGEWIDAVEFATMCNRQLCKPRAREDIKKAAFMILDTPEWFGRGDAWIAKHIGTSPVTITRYRVEFCEATNRKLPERVKVRRQSQVHTTPYTRKTNPEFKTRTRRRLTSKGVCSIDWYKNVLVSQKKIYARTLGRLADGCRAIAVCEYVCVALRDELGSLAIPCAIGEAVVAGALVGGPRKKVVLTGDSPMTVRRTVWGPAAKEAERLGIQFMTLEDLIAAIRGSRVQERDPKTKDVCHALV